MLRTLRIDPHGPTPPDGGADDGAAEEETPSKP